MGYSLAKSDTGDFLFRSLLLHVPATEPQTSPDALSVLSNLTYASHGAGAHLRDGRGIGARARGVFVNAYKKNAGGRHPPGRNADCRH